MEFFRHAVFGLSLIKRRKVTFRPGIFAVAERLCDPLAVDAVVYRERVAALADGVHLVKSGVGDMLVGKVVDDELVGAHACHCIGIGGMLVIVNTHPVLRHDIAVAVELAHLADIGQRSRQIRDGGRRQAVELVVGELGLICH